MSLRRLPTGKELAKRMTNYPSKFIEGEIYRVEREGSKMKITIDGEYGQASSAKVTQGKVELFSGDFNSLSEATDEIRTFLENHDPVEVSTKVASGIKFSKKENPNHAVRDHKEKDSLRVIFIRENLNGAVWRDLDLLPKHDLGEVQAILEHSSNERLEGFMTNKNPSYDFYKVTSISEMTGIIEGLEMGLAQAGGMLSRETAEGMADELDKALDQAHELNRLHAEGKLEIPSTLEDSVDTPIKQSL